MDTSENEKSKRKWKKTILRASVAQPEDVEIHGTTKVSKIYSSVLKHRDLESELYNAIKEVVPEWWGDDTQITLNKDLICQRHRPR
jgi:hypothetical protein